MPALPPSRSSAQSASCNNAYPTSLACAASCRSFVCEWASPPVIWWSARSARTTARSFTVIGDIVNLASRLEGANNAYETSILVDGETFQLAQNDIEGREIDVITVFGKVEPVRVYEIMAPAGGLSDAEQELRGLFAEGLAAYRARDWDRSEQRFAQCLAVMPADGPATVFRRRCEFLRGKTLPADWDGVWQLTDK